MKAFDDITQRPPWMRPPQWRWMQSEEFLANPTLLPDSGNTDEITRELIRFKRYAKKNIDKPHKYWKKYPSMSTAYHMYLSSISSGWRWILEAYLMTDLTNKEITKRLKVDMDERVIRRYRRIFFDIEHYRNSEAAVTANLLATSKVKLDATGISDYTWKLFAYVWGPDAFEQMFFPKGGRRKREHMDWMREMNSKNLDIYSFHLTQDLQNQYTEDAMNILNTARNYWDLKDNDLSDLNQQSKREFIDVLSRKVHMKILDANEKEDTTYTESFSEDASEIFSKAAQEGQK